MSDIMLYGVLRMPYELAMSDEISRLQFYQRAQEAVDRLEACETTNTPSQTPIFDQEEFDKMVKDGTKIWAGVDISRDARQAASIDTPEFRQLLKDYSFYGIERGTPPLIAHIDAKLAQAREEATGMLAIAFEKMLCAAIGRDWSDAGISASSLVDDLRNRTIAAESRLAEIQRGVEGLNGRPDNWVYRPEVLALLQPQGQANTSGLPG